MITNNSNVTAAIMGSLLLIFSRAEPFYTASCYSTIDNLNNFVQPITGCYRPSSNCASGDESVTTFQNAPGCCDKHMSYADADNECIACAIGGMYNCIIIE